MSSSSSSSIPIWVLPLSFYFFCTCVSPSSSTTSPLKTVSNATLYGDAHLKSDTISLTRERSCLPVPPSLNSSFSSSSGMGRAIYTHPIRFLDSATNSTASFSSRFSFSIIPAPMCPFGDGFTFLITSNSTYTPLPISGHLGLPEPAANSGKESFVAVEFDTSFDPSLGDVGDNHVGIDLNTAISFASADSTRGGFDLKSRSPMTAWIDYRHAAKMIRVWLGYSLVRPSLPVLAAQIDLSEHLREYMHVGFTASNGEWGSAIHLVGNWRFKTSGSVAPSVMPVDAVAVEEGDCFMCFPEEPEPSRASKIIHREGISLTELILGLGGLAAFLISATVIFTIGCWMLRKRRFLPSRWRKENPNSRTQINRSPTTLTLAEVKSATLGFNPNRIIGQGASATVYQGLLPSGEAVAVKRFSPMNRRASSRDPFTTEFATMVSSLRHKNLVQLQGWCCEGNELILVYEYLPNGSLDKFLHNDPNSSHFLTWKQRFRIVHGIASVLTYLHEECERQIIHRDVKSCNIMLDAEFNPKLGDFGLAEVYEHSSSNTHDATIPEGTMGYLAPEYVYSGIPTEKTDVYSFGVVILEVATGRRPVEDDGLVVNDWVWEMWERGRITEASDSRLRGKFDPAEMKRLLMVGLSCVHPNCERRPTVREVGRILKGNVELPVLPTRKPMVTIRSVLPELCEEEVLNFCGEGSTSVGMEDDPLWLTPTSRFSKD